MTFGQEMALKGATILGVSVVGTIVALNYWKRVKPEDDAMDGLGEAKPRRTRQYSTGQLRWLVDRMHVGDTDEEVRREIRRRTASWPKDQARSAERAALRMHHANQKLYRQVMSGQFK